MFGLFGAGTGKRARRGLTPRLGLECLESRYCPANIIYWEAGGATDQLWSTPANWKDDAGNQRLPTANDTIIFDKVHSNEHSTQDILTSVAIKRLEIGNLYDGTLTVPTNLTVKDFELSSSASLGGNGALFIATGGTGLWRAGIIKLCSTTVEANASFDIDTRMPGQQSTVTLSGGLFNNAGTVNYDDSVKLTLNSASFVNQENSLFVTQGSVGERPCTLLGNPGGGSSFIQESGSWLKMGDDFEIKTDVATRLSCTITNLGIAVPTLTLKSGSEMDGTIVNSSDLVLVLGGGVVHKWNAVDVRAGQVRAPDATVQLTGTNKLGGKFDLVNTKVLGGTLAVTAGGRFVLSDGLLDGVTVTVAANGEIEFTDSQNNATFAVNSTSITNSGKVTFERADEIKFGGANGSTFTNAATGLVVVKDNTAMLTGKGAFANAGTLTVSDPAAMAFVDLEIGFDTTNSGTITVYSVLKVTGDYTQIGGATNLADTDILNVSGDVKINGGSLNALDKRASVRAKTLVNGGTVSLAKSDTVFDLTGDYTQTAKGTLKIAVTALDSATSKLEVSGKAKLDGTVAGTVENPIGNAQTFTFLSFASQMGKFKNLTTADATLKKYNFKYNATDAQLVADAPPCGADTTENTPVTVTVLSPDAAANPSATVNATNGTYGTVVINPDRTVTYTPNANWNGIDTFLYTYSDGAGGTVYAQVTVAVTPGSLSPAASSMSLTTPRDTPVTVDLRALVTDPVTSPVNLIYAVGGAQNGTVVLLADGFTAQLTPAPGYSGPASFAYTVTDASTGTSRSSSATVSVAVIAPPTASAPTVTAQQNAPLNIDLSGLVSGASNPTFAVGSATNGTVQLLADGYTARFTPNAGYSGPASFGYTVTDPATGLSASATVSTPVNTPPRIDAFPSSHHLAPGQAVSVYAFVSDPDSDPVTIVKTQPGHGTVSNVNGYTFTYTAPSTPFVGTTTFDIIASDGRGGVTTRTVSVTLTNTAPTATADTASTNEDTAVTVSVLANDTDTDSDPLAVVGAGDGAHGKTTFTATGVIYTPDANWSGTDSFVYAVGDGFGGVSYATVTVTVAPVNDAPVAVNTSVMTPQNTAKDIDLRTLVTDVETAAADLTFAVSGATNGTVALLADGHTARFTPNAGYHGTATFAYTATDTGDGTSAALTTSAKTVSISVNSGPSAADVSGALHAGGTVMPPLAWTDPDGDMVNITAFTAETAHGWITSGMMGMGLTYTAKTQTYTGTDTFTYTISDGHGGFSTGTVTLALTNAPPTASSFDLYVHSGGSIGAIPMYFDADYDAVTMTGFTQGQHGSVTQGLMGATTLTYQAASPTYVGDDYFEYTVDDGHGGTATGRISMHLTNTPPTAWNTTMMVNAGMTTSVPAMYSDADGDTVTITSVTQPTSGGGTVTLVNGVIYYAAPSGFSGTVTFTYTVSDGHGGTATATVTITVTA